LSIKNSGSTIDQDELDKFSDMAEEWWDKNGKFKPLHKLNPVRISYIRDSLCQYYNLDNKSQYPLKNLNILDIGCGGGLISEPMSKLGASVTAIDPIEKNINIAKIHAEKSKLNINYICQTIEDFSCQNQNKFDIILNLEAIEHVKNPQNFIQLSQNCLNNNGIMFISTINRNIKSFFFTIIGAEYFLRWLPIGTHDWKKFFKPSEILQICENCDLKFLDSKGFEFNILKNEWFLSENLDINYISSFKNS
jgi:2-polyprenyl-6-hydroxyphenyl methylase/3-demethylubiquinone-9 3-methyltransferase